MWHCPTCGEANEDHFQRCWNCVSAELPPEAHRDEPAPRPLRSLGSVLLYAVVAFALGTLAGIAISHRNGRALEEAVLSGLIIGCAIGGAVGAFIWVAFPYGSTTAPPPDAPDAADGVK